MGSDLSFGDTASILKDQRKNSHIQPKNIINSIKLNFINNNKMLNKQMVVIKVQRLICSIFL